MARLRFELRQVTSPESRARRRPSLEPWSVSGPPRRGLLQLLHSAQPLQPLLGNLPIQLRSAEAEAFRGIRTALYFGSGSNGKGPRTIQVTSPTAGDGKSTMAANLAISIAQSGKSCLLIDADLRRPRVHELFSAPADRGLATIIANETELDDALIDSGVPGLCLLPCGPLPPNPSELLTSARLLELLETLRQRYDVIIIDSPPMLAVSDPSMVAALVDAVVVTVRLAKNRRPEIERALDMLQGLDANLLGVVANVSDMPRNLTIDGYGTYDHQGNDSYYVDPPLRRGALLPSPPAADKAVKI